MKNKQYNKNMAKSLVTFTPKTDIIFAGGILKTGEIYALPIVSCGSNWVRVELNDSPVVTKTLFNFEFLADSTGLPFRNLP